MRHNQPAADASGRTRPSDPDEGPPQSGYIPWQLGAPARKILTFPLVLCLLLMATAFVALRLDRGHKGWRSMARQWPRLHHLKLQLQWFLREFRRVGPQPRIGQIR